MVGVAGRVIGGIVSIILSHKPAERIVLFGSRARGTADRTSDIDIAVLDTAWTQRDVNLVHDRLEEEVPTPLKIDLLAPRLLANEDLRSCILREGVVIHE